jgi:N-acetylneuraminic acid mutarotase
VGEHVYVLGGYSGEPHSYSREGQSDEVWRLSLGRGGKWERVGRLPVGLQGLAAVDYGDEVCRFGGNRVDNVAGSKAAMVSVTDAACLHTKTGVWRKLPDLPSGRSSHEAARIGSTVYLAGGWQLGDGGTAGGADSGVFKKDVLALDLASPGAQWTVIEAPFEQRAVGVATAWGKLFVLGGLTPAKKPTSQVHVFDPSSRSWSSGPDLPSDGFGLAALGSERTLVASSRDGALYRMNDVGGSWARAGAWTFPRFFHRLAWRSPTELVVVGGITGMHTHGRTRHTEVARLDDTKPEVSTVEIDYPGTAKNRQVVVVHDDFLYLFGGNNSLGQHDFASTNFTAEGHRLHLPSLTFAKAAPYPVPRQTMQSVKTEGGLVSVGGFGHDGEAAVSFNEAFRFDFAKEEWSKIGGLPRGRTQFGLVAEGADLFVFGGLNYDPKRPRDTFDHVTDTLRAPLAPKAGSSDAFVDAKIKLPGPRRAFGGALLGGEYFIVGGMKDNFQLVEDCLRFSFKTKKFASLPCPAKPRLSSKLLALGGKLYAVAGSRRGDDGKMSPDRSVEVFDPATNAWTVLVDDVGFDTHHAHAVAYGDRILVVSTHNDRGRLLLATIRVP